MKTLSVLAALTLTPFALACPVKQGYVANGLFKNTAGAKPICGPLYQTFRFSMAGVKWTEMYEVKAGRVGQLRTSEFLALIRRGRYRLVKQSKTVRSQVYLFERGSHSITVVVGVSGGAQYIGLAGQ